MRNKQFISLIIILLTVFALTAVVMKYYQPIDTTEREKVLSLKEKQEIQNLIGQAYFAISQEEYESAERTLYRLFEKSPNNILALQMLGQIYFKTKRYASADKIFRKLILLQPQIASNYNNLGQSLAYQKDYKNGITYLRRSLELDPNVTMPYFNLAEVYMKMGDKKQAIIELKKAIEIARSQRVLILNINAFKELEGEVEYRDLIKNLIKELFQEIEQNKEQQSE